MAKSNLPAAAHDHFRQATIIHGYVEEHLQEASKYALEAGEALLAAKKVVPHGRWEEECDRLFAPSARTARFYMEFARHMSALPKRQQSAILMLEGSLTGAAKLAKEAANKTAKKSSVAAVPNAVQGELVTDSELPLEHIPFETAEPEPEPDPVDPDAEFRDQRLKTRKLAESLMRAVDDLVELKPYERAADCIGMCRRILTALKGWK